MSGKSGKENGLTGRTGCEAISNTGSATAVVTTDRTMTALEGSLWAADREEGEEPEPGHRGADLGRDIEGIERPDDRTGGASAPSEPVLEERARGQQAGRDQETPERRDGSGDASMRRAQPHTVPPVPRPPTTARRPPNRRPRQSSPRPASRSRRVRRRHRTAAGRTARSDCPSASPSRPPGLAQSAMEAGTTPDLSLSPRRRCPAALRRPVGRL